MRLVTGFIWNNRNILYRHKSLFLRNWFDNDIKLVSQLYNKEGTLFFYDKFLY